LLKRAAWLGDFQARSPNHLTPPPLPPLVPIEEEPVALHAEHHGLFHLNELFELGDLMKIRHFVFCGSFVWLACLTPACTANIHDNTLTANIPNAMLSFTTDADVNNVMPDQTVPIVATVQNVYLIDPAMTPPPEHAADAGHLQVYLDDVSTTPLLVTAQVTFDVTIPSHTPAGHHRLICRVHKHDGTPTNTEFQINVTVAVSVSVGPVDAASDASVTVSVDASGTAVSD
jgi:hypothetical protein